MKRSRRAARNILVMYFRQIISVFVGLFSTRYVFQALGVSDFGLFNVMMGSIGLIAFVSVSLTLSTQRYLAVNFSKPIDERQRVFGSSVFIHVIMALFVFILIFSLKNIVVHRVLNVAIDQMLVAVECLSVLGVGIVITLFAIPYEAALNARENMIYDSVISIAESLFRLIAAILLLHYSGDRLILFSQITVLSIFLSKFAKIAYCITLYEECRFDLLGVLNRKLLIELSSFLGWNSFGAGAVVLRNQGQAIALNHFVGNVANAAYAIGSQVSTQLQTVNAAVSRAIMPQIMKLYGEGCEEGALRLANTMVKMLVVLSIIISVPITVEMNFILQIWLKSVPENAVVFTIIMVWTMVIMQVSAGIQILIQCFGKVGEYQRQMFVIQVLLLPTMCTMLVMKVNVWIVMLANIVLELLLLFSRNKFFSKHISVFQYSHIKSHLVAIISASVPGLVLGIGLKNLIEPGLIRVLVVSFISGGTILGIAWLIYFDENERTGVSRFFIRSVIHRKGV